MMPPPSTDAAPGERRSRWPALKWPVALAGVSAASLGAMMRHPALAEYPGIRVIWGWFIDVYALLAAGEAHLRGMAVDRPIPLDVLSRAHSYSHWWLWLGNIGLERADTMWLGPLLGLGFIAVAAGTMRPRSEPEFLWSAGILLSGAVQLALVRANNDLVVFLLLAPLVPMLRASHPGWRLAAPLLIALVTGLKYYPVVAALLLLHADDRRLFWWRLGLAAALFAAVAVDVAADLRVMRQTAPAPFGLFAFGAPLLLAKVGLPVAVGPWVGAGWALICLGWELRRSPKPSVGRASGADLQFVLGAVLIGSCFWLTMNWSYRWVFAIWLVPVLLGRGEGWLPFSARQRRLLLAGLIWLLSWDAVGALLWNIRLTAGLGMTLDQYDELWMLAIQPVTWAFALLFTWVGVRFAVYECRRLVAAPASRAVTAVA